MQDHVEAYLDQMINEADLRVGRCKYVYLYFSLYAVILLEQKCLAQGGVHEVVPCGTRLCLDMCDPLK